jgi:hypothetical protein
VQLTPPSSVVRAGGHLDTIGEESAADVGSGAGTGPPNAGNTPGAQFHQFSFHGSANDRANSLRGGENDPDPEWWS